MSGTFNRAARAGALLGALAVWSPDLHADGRWLITTIDSAGTAGKWPSIAVDGKGCPHIAYCASTVTGLVLRYASLEGGDWPIEVAATSNDVTKLSLALDASDRPQVAYKYGSVGLAIAHREGDTWTSELVDPGDYNGRQASLALDPQGQPHISYNDSSVDDLRYAYRDGESWHLETVESAGRTGLRGSIAVDAAGKAHIGFYNDSLVQVRYAHREATGWSVETVAAPAAIPAMTLDNLDRPHFIYQSVGGNNPLVYAWYDGSSWQSELVPGLYDTEWHNICVDSAGRPHIAFWDYYWDNLMYATRDPEGWRVETVDSAGRVGEYASMALDSDGIPHIAYYDSTNTALKYATVPEPAAFGLLGLGSLGLIRRRAAAAAAKAARPSRLRIK